MERTDTRLPLDPVLPRETALEIDTIESEIVRFTRGELSPERFRSFRLANGIYGQRQQGVQMIRVKIPAGNLDGRQLRRIADIADEFSPTGIAHLTTRQDVQLHFVPLEQVPRLLRLLAEVGLTTREACGNSVRNVTACPLTGFVADELFDVRPHAQAVYAYLVRNPFCQQLARKFKIALSSCPEDCASTGIHDIGLVGRIEGEDGGARLGFKVVVGGGLGTTPFTAKVLEEFVPLDQVLPTVKGILQVFSEYGNRRNKMKARLKFVVNKLGIDEFRRRVAAAVEGLTEEERREADLLDNVPEPCRPLVSAQLAGTPDGSGAGAGPAALAEKFVTMRSGRAGPGADPARSEGTLVSYLGGGPIKADAIPSRIVGESSDQGIAPDAAFLRWRTQNVREHRDPTRAVVTLVFPLGDLEADRLRKVASLTTDLGSDRARIAINQNLVLPDVERGDLRALYDRLAALELAEASAGTALDVTACPGADTCGLGITSSKGLARALRSELLPLASNGGLDLLQDVTIKISGCPNSCGQHHVANIGLHGVSKNVGGRQIPSYQLHLGGGVAPGEARIGKPLDKIPARNVPKAVAALLTLYQRGRREGEPFADFVNRAPHETIAALLAPFAAVAGSTAASAAAGEGTIGTDLGVDWGQDRPFTTDEIGAGECAGAGTDVAVNPFDNYEAEILQAEIFMKREQWVDALANLNRSQYTLARILLERLGKVPESDYETICELRAQVIDRGHMSDLWNEFHREAAEAMKTRAPSASGVAALHARTRELLGEAARALPVLEKKHAEGHREVAG